MKECQPKIHRGAILVFRDTPEVVGRPNLQEKCRSERGCVGIGYSELSPRPDESQVRRLETPLFLYLCANTLNMKKILLLALSIVLSSRAMAQDYLVSSGHALSWTIEGLEYSYEQPIGGNWSVVARAGLPCTIINAESEIIDGERTVTFNFGPCPGIVIEPRFYTNIQRRAAHGRRTANNCADFVSMQAKPYYHPCDDALYVTAIAAYGIRRSGSNWFREYTFGAAYHSMWSGFLPHIGFRLGYTF